MVERITDPHKPVQVHGYGRLPDGQPGPYGVPQPSRASRKGMSRGDRIGWTLVGLITLALFVAGVIRGLS